MAINFLPNDPLAQAEAPLRQQLPRAEPAAQYARFQYSAAVPEAIYAAGTPEFLFWQCREAALGTLETWAAIASPLTRWQSGNRLLPLRHQGGQGLNAHYDRAAVSFLEWSDGTKATYSAASTDAVAHEIGHALLDAIRSDLWDSVYTEPAAFHESFADCMALLVGLSDAGVRQRLVQQPPGVGAPNFLEALAEDIADGVRRDSGASHPHAAPRRALNTFRWEIPINLPAVGPPSLLTTEPHSFSRVFTGCFYDTICNVFAEQPGQSEQDLRAAAQFAGRLLVTAAQGVPEVARFFQAVGRAMILADEASDGGRYHIAIRNAFANHNIALGSSAMLAPTTALAGAPPNVAGSGGKALMAPDSRRHLLQRIGAKARSRLRVVATELGGQVVAKAIHRRSVPLGVLDRRLKGVIVPAVESVLVGASARRAAVLGQLPDPLTTVDEVQHFVHTLLQHGSLALRAGRQRPATRARDAEPFLPTHAIRTRSGRRVVTRVRFSCCRYA
ncbi:MAG: hypothetical protein ACT4NU_09340 [Chromatiales bacterium]